MAVDGTYTLLIEGDPYDTGTTDYSFTVQPVPTPVPTPLTLGATVSGDIATAGRQDLYTFTLAADTLAAFDDLITDSNLLWSLVGPAGQIVSNLNFPYSDSFNGSPYLLPAGDYQLTVSASGDATGAYSFRLLDLGDAVPLPPGVQVDGTLDPANETQAYRFTAAAGDKFYFDSLSSNTQNASWQLVDPHGEQVVQDYLSNDIGVQHVGGRWRVHAADRRRRL